MNNQSSLSLRQRNSIGPQLSMLLVHSITRSLLLIVSGILNALVGSCSCIAKTTSAPDKLIAIKLTGFRIVSENSVQCRSISDI